MELYYDDKENTLIYVNKDRKVNIPVIGYLDKKDYKLTWPTVIRIAVRAIINIDGRYLMVHINREKYYTFPGGGVEGKESLEQALIREVKEETGYEIIPFTIKPYVAIISVKSNEYFNGKKEIFNNISVYFKAEVYDKEHVPKLTSSEIGRGLRRMKVGAEQAYLHNEKMLTKSKSHTEFLQRENLVLKELMNTDKPSFGPRF